MKYIFFNLGLIPNLSNNSNETIIDYLASVEASELKELLKEIGQDQKKISSLKKLTEKVIEQRTIDFNERLHLKVGNSNYDKTVSENVENMRILYDPTKSINRGNGIILSDDVKSYNFESYLEANKNLANEVQKFAQTYEVLGQIQSEVKKLIFFLEEEIQPLSKY